MYSDSSSSSSGIVCPHPDIEIYECYSCKESGCDKCIKVVCCDCCVKMCSNCTYDDDILCGCYGNCYTCDTEVNRGEHGWPCSTCHKWFCSLVCRSKNNCIDCQEDEDKNE